METVTVSRRFDAPPDRVRDLVADAESFMRAGGFDGVTVDDDTIQLTNQIGFATFELELERLETDAALAFRQREGMFDTMETAYEVAPAGDGTRVTATTEFALGRSVVGELLDATIVRRQRVREIENQFDYLADALAE